MLQRILLLTVLLFTFGGAGAQTIVSSRQINSANGLSNNFVLSMALDGKGNVWVGTEAGLNRIAGRTVNVFRREQMGSTNDKILALFYDRHSDRMLIANETGLLIHNPKNNTFGAQLHGDSLINYGINAMADDHRQGVWLIYGNGRIQHLNLATDELSTLPCHLPGSRSAMDDGEGHLYVGHSQEGMSIVNLKRPDDVRHFTHQEHDDASLPGNNVRRILHDNQGLIWVGTDRGLALFSPATGTFTPVSRPSQFSSPALDPQHYDNVFDILQLDNGQRWMTTDVGGIVTDDEACHVEVSSMNTRCILEDDYHNIWIGNHSTGIDFIPHKKPFLSMAAHTASDGQRQRRIYGITHDRQGNIWVSSEDELSRWLCEGGTLRLDASWHITGMKHRAHSFARCLMADSRGHVWMGMEDEGVIRFDTRTNRFETIDIGYDVCDIHSFFEDVDGRVWIGAEYGVCIYDQGRITHAEDFDRLTKRAPVTGFIRLAPDRLMLTTQGNGIAVVNPRTMAAQTLKMADGLPTNNINQMLLDRQQGIWLATNKGLLLLPDAQDFSRIVVYDAAAGLTDNQVRAIQQDVQGRIWASTYTSIACLDPTTKTFYNFTQQDDLNVSGFTEGAAATTADGTIVFSSPVGLCYFQPKETQTDRKVSPVRIALCEVFSPTKEGNITQQCQPDAEGLIRVGYRQNTLRIAYTVGDYAQVGDVEYSYLMKGLSDKWYYNDTDYDVMFRSLRPGNYTFILRARLKGQEWNQCTTTQLHIRITPPLWQTWWAYSVYTLAACALLLWIFRQYKRRLALHHSLELTRRESLQKQELNEERLRFFTNVTHELRTPLTLILGPLEDLKDGIEQLRDKGKGSEPHTASHQLTTQLLNNLSLISKHAQRLRDLINDILEFRKTETQNRRLTVARGDLGQFVCETTLSFKELNRNPKVDIVLDIASQLPPVYFDSEVITTVLTNLLSNAMKYTEQGTITVSLKPHGSKQLALSVADTGYGIAADALPHIFESYYQAKGIHQASGTGIGLALVKSLADLHEAQLAVESEEGHGSRFTLTLDTVNDYPNALHKEDALSEMSTTVLTTTEYEPQQTDDEKASPQLLIVEDNTDIRQYIADSLGVDFRILQAENGTEGLMAAREQMPDIIVSDIMMPKMSGLELTRQLKNDISTSHIPIILLTAKDTDEDKETGYEIGADSYLTKPFTAKLLASRVRNLLTSRRRLAEMLGTWGQTPTATKPASETTAEMKLSRLDREFIERLNHIIEDNIIQTDIDMAFLTDKMAMSHSTFYRKVKALTGLTAKEYVRKQRLRYCYRLLQSGDYNVSEAAMMTGFNQMAHFRETFKHEFGVLPSEVGRTKKINQSLPVK